MLDELKRYVAELGADLSEKKGVWTFSKVIAERKAFLSKKKLTYTAKFRVDDSARLVKFTEMLVESGSGLSSGGGFGFKAETYKSGLGGREGTIEEQSKLFGKNYSYTFSYQEVRNRFESLAKSGGYEFKYQVTPIGL
jgi:hypothetical protein